MFKNLGKKLQFAGLYVLRVALYIVIVPVSVPFLMYGLWFIFGLFCLMVLIDAAAISALLVFVASFYTGIVALFAPDLWVTIGSWWSWMGNWIPDWWAFVWPHLRDSFPIYLVTGIIFTALANAIQGIDRKTKVLKALVFNHKPIS